MDLISLLNLSVRLAGPVLLVALGGIFASRVNIFNLALEGFMLMGAFSSIVGAYVSNSIGGGIVIAALTSMALILIYAVFIFELHVDPTICAIAVITISSGLTRYLLVPIFDCTGRYILPQEFALPTIHLPLLDHIPVLGQALNDHSILVYLALLLPFVVHILLYRTRFGLSIRAVGLNDEVAASAGISVKRTRYIALAINGLMCGLAGAQLALSLNMFNVGMTNGRGFTALAAITLTQAEPIPTLLVCLLFGFAEAIVLALSGQGYSVHILSMLPYFLALAAAIIPPVLRLIIHRSRRIAAERRTMERH